MEEAASTGGIPTTRQEDGCLAWRVHLLADRPRRGIAVLALLGILAYFIYASFGTLYFLLAVALFTVNLGPFFFPVHYTLTPAGVTRRILFFRTTRGWHEFRNFYSDQDGVKLSTLSSRSRLEAYRGIFLRFGKNREEVMAYVAGKVTRPGTTPPTEREAPAHA